MRHLVASVGLRRNDPLYLRGTAARRTEEKGLGYRIIGAMKLASALLLGLAGFGIFRFLLYIKEEILLVLATSSSALAIAPFIPLGPGVSTSSAPKASSSTRRSRLIVSGIVRMSL